LRAIRSFRWQIAAGALIQTNTTSFASFRIFLHFSWIGFHGKELVGLHNWQMKTPLLLYLKGLLGPFCFCSKRYLIPFCRMQKGISYCLKIQKNPRKQKCIACGAPLPFDSLLKGLK
jgi:hypothetical protein